MEGDILWNEKTWKLNNVIGKGRFSLVYEATHEERSVEIDNSFTQFRNFEIGSRTQRTVITALSVSDGLHAARHTHKRDETSILFCQLNNVLF